MASRNDPAEATKPASPEDPAAAATPVSTPVALPPWMSIQTQISTDSFARLWGVQMRFHALSTGQIVYRREGRHVVKAEKLIQERGFRPFAEHIIRKNRGGKKICLRTYVSEYGVAQFGSEDTDTLSIESFRKEDLHGLFRKPFFRPKTSGNHLYMLASTSHGLSVNSISRLNTPFVAENYPIDVSREFPEVARLLQEKDPDGRFFLFEGPKGTGKTHYIEALCTACEGARFVLLPTHMISQLGNPGLLSCLLDFQQENEPKPMVLVLEDADSTLAKKKQDNVHHVSALLNMTAGMFGHIFDLRVIATTNTPASELDLDEALLRDGRLGRYIKFKNLAPEEAQRALDRLLATVDGAAETQAKVEVPSQDKESTHKVGFSREKSPYSTSLASVYKQAKKLGYRAPTENEEGDDATGRLSDCEARYKAKAVLHASGLAKAIPYKAGKKKMRGGHVIYEPKP